MLVIGARGFAKDLLQILELNQNIQDLAFFDDVNSDNPNYLFNKYLILKSKQEAKMYFEEINSNFTLGIGNPLLRRKLSHEFAEIGGILTSTISNVALIGNNNTSIGVGSNIMSNVVITNDVKIGTGTIIYHFSSISHDVSIGNFCQINASVSILGNCEIGENVFIGAGATLLPNITVGNNVTIGAGATVISDLPDNCVAVGVPARIVVK
jgi:sugar O-acyltransferase (sialic acid O-acetyltransferase NeuD family)